MSTRRYGDDLKMVLKESEWKNKPSKIDYSKAKRLLNDFGIKIKIPECRNLVELQRFTREQIHNYL